MKPFYYLWFSLSLWFFPLLGNSILETTSFPSFCEKAANDKMLFDNFKRDRIYQDVVENVSFEMGQKYLDVIVQEYPELVALFDQFRQNDAIGNPVTYDYGIYGFFSPTTLRYIKVAGDLKHRFGDLSQKHIVEIGKGCATLCKILSDRGGFASYTFIDLPDCNVLTEKCLSAMGVSNVIFIDKAKLSPLQSYDLIISNFSFSECDSVEQNRYLDELIGSIPYGYLTMNYITPYFGMKSLSKQQLDFFLFCKGKKGKMESESPSSHPDNYLITWEPLAGYRKWTEI